MFSKIKGKINLSKSNSIIKIDCSPVTIADYAVQATIAILIKREFKGEAFK